jgi:hypothetical protein
MDIAKMRSVICFRLSSETDQWLSRVWMERL